MDTSTRSGRTTLRRKTSRTSSLPRSQAISRSHSIASSTRFRAGGDNTIFGNQPDPDVTNNYAFNVDFTKIHGAHTLEFGGEIDEFQYGGFRDSGGHANGNFHFNSH